MPTLSAPRIGLAPFVLLSCALACAAPRARLGEIELRPPDTALTSPVLLEVEEGRITGDSVDLAIGATGCLVGGEGAAGWSLCPVDAAPGEQAWAGAGGKLVTRFSAAQDAVAVDGWLTLQGSVRPLHGTLALGAGPAWDELRRKPALLALAAALVAQHRGLGSPRAANVPPIPASTPVKQEHAEPAQPTSAR